MSAAENTPARGKGKPLSAKDRAKAITEALEGEWDETEGKGRYAQCLVCEALEMSVTPTPKAILVHCHRCGKAGQRRLFALARKGFDLRGDPPPSRNHRRKGLPVAELGALAALKPIDRRILYALAALADASKRGWIEASNRWTVATAKVSFRAVKPALDRFEQAKLLTVHGNGYKQKRVTQVRFLIDPAALLARLDDVWGSPKVTTKPKPENGSSCYHFGSTMEGRGGLRTYAGKDESLARESTSFNTGGHSAESEGEVIAKTRWKPPCGEYECHDDCVTRRSGFCERMGVRLLD